LGIEYRGYEYSPGTTRIEFNLDHPQLRDLRVRQAIAHAINRQVILQTAWYGYGVEAPSPVSPLLTRFYDAGVEKHPFDPAKAERLLDGGCHAATMGCGCGLRTTISRTATAISGWRTI
jgi:peptide/nickel transport system substrate-binding protein